MFDTATLAVVLLPLIRKYGAEGTAIIAPHVDSNRALSMFTNLLSQEHNVPVSIPISDEGTLDDAILSGKLCVSTYHQFKGNERDLFIVYGVDESYFTYIARDTPDNCCPNATFVALTRACKQLVVLHDKNHPPMPFIDMQELYKTADFRNLANSGIKDVKPTKLATKLGLMLPAAVSASRLARHVPDEILDEICKRHLDISVLNESLPEEEHIITPAKVLTNYAKQYYEAVSDINGIAVVAAYERLFVGTLKSLGYKSNHTPHFDTKDTATWAAWLCKEACKYEAEISGYKSRAKQMEHHTFDWLGPYLSAALDRLKAQFSNADKLEFETRLEEKVFELKSASGDIGKTRLVGRADIISYKFSSSDPHATKAPKKKSKRHNDATLDETVYIWEIKFVAQLSSEHIIQACVYGYLWSRRKKSGKLPKIILFNVKDRKKLEIIPRNGIVGLRNVMEDVMTARYTGRETLSTDKFVKECAKTMAEVQDASISGLKKEKE